jgi:hypothetical protein
MAQPVIVLDLTAPGRGHGYVTGGVDGGVDILLSVQGSTWRIFGGAADQYSAEGSSLAIVLRRFAMVVGVHGTADVVREYSDWKVFQYAV